MPRFSGSCDATGRSSRVDAHDAYWRFLAHAFEARAPLTRALRGRLTPRELRRLGPVLGFDASAFPRDLDARQWALLFGFAAGRP